MKIITWNINSLRFRLDLIERVTKLYKPDILCLQETKVDDPLFPVQEIKNMGYKSIVYNGQKSYHGVAILSMLDISKTFSLESFNQYGARHIAICFNDIELHNFYVPAGGDIPDPDENPKFKYKLLFLDMMKSWFCLNRAVTDKIVLLGDLNVAPYEHDVWSSKQLTNVVSHTPVEREKLLAIKDSMKFIDSARYFIPIENKLYSWWSYRNIDWKKSNRGRRLDHIWVSKELESKMIESTTIYDTRDWKKTSDHVPVILEIST